MSTYRCVYRCVSHQSRLNPNVTKFLEISTPTNRLHLTHHRHFGFLSAEHDPNARLKRKRTRKLTGKKRIKAHRKRLVKSLNVMFHPALRKTPIINTKYKEPDTQQSLTNAYLSTFEKIKQSLALDKLSDYVDIMYCDANIIAINKAPGILTARANDNTLDMQNILKSYIFKHRDFRDWKRYLVKSIFDKFTKMEPFVGVLHRLDKSTSGVTLYGRHEKSTKAMINLFSQHKVKKTYIAVVKGEPPKKSDDLEHYIATTDFPKVRIITVAEFKAMNTIENSTSDLDGLDTNDENNTDNGEDVVEANVIAMKKHGEKLKWKKARLHYRHLQSFVYQRQQYSVLRVHCFTGRQHQVRAQLSMEKIPIIGDTKYKCRIPFIPNKNEDAIALHAWLLEYQCPLTGEMKSIEAPLPDYWNDRFGSQIHSDVFDHL
eukprot:71189_1